MTRALKRSLFQTGQSGRLLSGGWHWIQDGEEVRDTHGDIWRRNGPAGEDSRCKGPEAGLCWEQPESHGGYSRVSAGAKEEVE